MDSELLIHLQNKVRELSSENQFLKTRIKNLTELLENSQNNGKH